MAPRHSQEPGRAREPPNQLRGAVPPLGDSRATHVPANFSGISPPSYFAAPSHVGTWCDSFSIVPRLGTKQGPDPIAWKFTKRKICEENPGDHSLILLTASTEQTHQRAPQGCSDYVSHQKEPQDLEPSSATNAAGAAMVVIVGLKGIVP